MNTFIPLGILLCVGMVGCSEQDLQLSGPDAVTVPAIAVPFLSSSTFIRYGNRDSQSGRCVFADDFTVDPGELAAGETKVRIQRGYDPVGCEELVEEGIAREVVLAAIENTPSLINAGTTYSATGKVAYLDAQSTLGGIVAPLLGGLDVSHVGATINLTSGDCKNSAPSASVGFNIGSETLLGWSAVTSSSWSQVTCTRVVAEALVVHGNSSNTPLATDCSDGASIEYNNFRMTMNMAGQRALSGSDGFRGDHADCGEYLARIQTLN